MSTLIPEGGQPDPQPCRRGERMDSKTRNGTEGRNRRRGRSHDSSPESTNDRRDMLDRVQAAEEDTLEDEQGEGYRSRGGDDGRERLKRHRREVAGRVWIPEIWGQEELLKDWVDCTVFDSSLVRSKIMSAKAALVEEGRRDSSPALPIENREITITSSSRPQQPRVPRLDNLSLGIKKDGESCYKQENDLPRRR